MKKSTNILLITKMARSLAADRQGVTAIEYGLIAGLIAVGIVATLGALNNNMISLFTTILNNVGSA
jgi:pilus assembly protein Flp/PilA